MPVTVVDDPKDSAFRRGFRGEVQKRIRGASYQVYQANTYADDKSPSAYGSGTTSYRVDILKCPDNCQCLIVVSVTGEVKGHVDADVTDYFLGKARATLDGRLWSSLGTSQAQLALASGDGVDGYEASAELGVPPKPNVKVSGKVGDGPLDKISAYSSGPISFSTCYADFSVTAEGSVNSFINWACSEDSYGQATLSILHECKISAYCVCNGERSLIFEWSRSGDGRSSYSKRSAKDEDYEKKMKRDREQLQTEVGKVKAPISKTEQAKLDKELVPFPRPQRRDAEDGLARVRDLFKTELPPKKRK